MANVIELGRVLESKRAEYRRKWEAYPTKRLADGQEVKDVPSSEIEGLRRLMDEINDLSVKHESARAVEATGESLLAQERAGHVPANRVAFGGETKGVADLVFASAQWQSRAGGRFGDVELSGKALDFIEGKAAMTTGAGFAPGVRRDGSVVGAVSRPPELIDFLRTEPTDQNSVKFMKQTTRTNAAAAKGENAAFDEATIVYTEATAPIRKIGVFLPVTEEQLEDEPGVRALIENDLRLMVRQRLDEQVTVGDGSGANLTGLMAAAGAQSQARGADDEFDQILKAMTKVRTGGRARPNLVVLQSANYQRLGLTKTAEGIYVFGNPADAPLTRIWGVQIVVSDALTAGTGMVLDSDYARIKLRRDLTIATSDSHASYFPANLIAMRAHLRAGLQILRDEAICKLSDLRS